MHAPKDKIQDWNSPNKIKNAPRADTPNTARCWFNLCYTLSTPIIIQLIKQNYFASLAQIGAQIVCLSTSKVGMLPPLMQLHYRL